MDAPKFRGILYESVSVGIYYYTYYVSKKANSVYFGVVSVKMFFLDLSSFYCSLQSDSCCMYGETVHIWFENNDSSWWL
jgi:hypothetical protein